MKAATGRPAFDIFRVVAAFLVVAIHVSPLETIDATADFIVTRAAARVAVPFFFMMTGYFLKAREDAGNRMYLYGFLKKTAFFTAYHCFFICR